MREIRPLRVMWRGLETELSYGSPRQSSTLPGDAGAEFCREETRKAAQQN
jgi:hypothetical protein